MLGEVGRRGHVWGQFADQWQKVRDQLAQRDRGCVSAQCRIQSPVGDSGAGTVTGQSWTEGLDPGVSLLSPPLWWPALAGPAAGAAAVVELRILTAPQHLHHPHPPPRRLPSRFLAQGLGHPGAGTGSLVQGE